ncbi:hypothetical protein APHAL10511_008490 [Amanita phalloides]|nr:hypothetical protein APHAL10511_008490 [Amanita phalloides]
MTSTNGKIYDPLTFMDEFLGGEEPPRKIITNYAALEAALAKDVFGNVVGEFPKPRSRRAPHARAGRGFFHVFWADTPAPEQDEHQFTPLTPAPRHKYQEHSIRCK